MFVTMGKNHKILIKWLAGLIIIIVFYLIFKFLSGFGLSSDYSDLYPNTHVEFTVIAQPVKNTFIVIGS